MPADKIRLGIIGANAGYGWSMRAHLPAILALPEFELTAVCTSRPETAAESAKAYGARLAFHDYQEMVSHPDIDLVSVSVRVPLHRDMVMAALAAGKHVFCEWPLGANLSQAEEMASLARSRGVSHMVGLQAQGSPALLRLRELVAEGYVGEMLTCNMTMFLPGLLQRGINMPWMADRGMGANTLTIATGHAIDAFCFCVGEFQHLSARVTTQVREWDTSEAGQDRSRGRAGQRTRQRRAGRRRCGLGAGSHRAMARERMEDGGIRAGRNADRVIRGDGPVREHPATGRSRR